MPELLILEFDGVTETDYAKINAALGLDPQTGAGNWPSGLISHVTGVTEGQGYVVEVWESQQAQAEFMHARLGAAMGAAGLDATPKVTWARVIGNHSPGA